LVSESPEGSIYGMPEYLDILCTEIGGKFKIVAVERAGELTGGIAIVERSCPWGRYVSGRLLLYYNGPVLKRHSSKYPSEHTSRAVETLAAMERTLSGMGYGRIHIKSRSSLHDVRPFLDRGWKAEPSYTYVVPLADISAVWSHMEQNLRRLATRCEREGMEVVESEDFDSFYRLHLQTHVRKGSALYLPKESFRRYFDKLHAHGLCRLFHAITPNGAPVSTQLVLLGPHSVSHTVCAATDAEYLRTGVTAYLRWRVFQRLRELGYLANDLTDAQLNPVTHFKSQLGGNLEMNLVVKKPESLAFQAQTTFYRGGSLVKSAFRATLKGIKRS
jgi:hypothetical protein